MTTPPAVPTPDLLLARRAAAGQEEAWREIVETYGARIFNLALQFSRSQEEAEDLTQDVFLRLHQSLRAYRGDVPFVGWAVRLSRNLCIDHYRRTRRERRLAAVPVEVLERIAGDADPHSDVEHGRRRRAILAALAEMPEDLAEVLVLRDLQGWTATEAATAMGVPEGTVKSRLHRARQVARDLLGPRLDARPRPTDDSGRRRHGA